jgi:flavin reductase (DIM6/NTAB) family NADH-FMN oxidoreductase RutF
VVITIRTDNVDSMGSVSAEVYRHAMSHLGGGVCLVTCRANGLDHAMTATAVIAVSLTPPLLLVSVDRKSRFHAALEAADDLAVTFLADHQVDLARHFARSGRDLATQFHEVGTRRLENGCLVLPDGLTSVGAHVESRLPGGDHTLVLAEMTEVMPGTAPASAGPLVHFSSGFHPLGDGGPLG